MNILSSLRLLLWLFRLPDLSKARPSNRKVIVVTINRLRVAIGWMMLAVVIGMAGYRLIEGSSWFDSYYMSLITLSTVGFGEVIPLSHAGRVFTSFLVLFNLGLFTFSVSTIFSIFADAEVRRIFMEFNMMDRINKLSGHTIICGFGRHGVEVCNELQKQKTPFVIIETDSRRIHWLEQESDYLFLEGDATEDFILKIAGIQKAGTLILTLPEMANNLSGVITARNMNPGIKIIARATKPADELKLYRAGADHVVLPERIGGFFMANLAKRPDLIEYISLLANMQPHDLILEEIPVKEIRKDFRGMSIEEVCFNAQELPPIVAIRYPNGRFELHPATRTVLDSDLCILVLGSPDQINLFRENQL
jgi:voltage-gated potassium channel